MASSPEASATGGREWALEQSAAAAVAASSLPGSLLIQVVTEPTEIFIAQQLIYQCFKTSTPFPHLTGSLKAHSKICWSSFSYGW